MSVNREKCINYTKVKLNGEKEGKMRCAFKKASCRWHNKDTQACGCDGFYDNPSLKKTAKKEGEA